MAAEEEVVRTPPAMWDYAYKTYMAMLDQSKTTEEAGVVHVVYTGFISGLMFDDLNVPVPYYGKILKALKAMGCVTQLRRGGGKSPSQWELWKTPTVEDFEKVWGQQQQEEHKTTPTESHLKDITRMLGGVDVPKALADLQEQVNLLKEKTHEHT